MFVFLQQQMSMILRTVKLLNQAKAEATDSERCAIKIETGTDTVNEEEEGANNANSSSTSSTIKRRVTIMPRRSKRVPKDLCDQVMTNQDSNAAIRSKDIDNSTAIGVTVTRKRNAEDSSFKSSREKGTSARTESFEGRYKQIDDFRDEFGHCNVPSKYSVNPSLGYWCGTIRKSYNQIQQGQTPSRSLTQDQIERLEEIGFKWKLVETFEQHCRDLEAFKSEFGHCNVPCKYSANPSFGIWCIQIRYSYNQIQQGQQPSRNLTQDQIERLEEIGFKWKIRETFEQRCHDLEAFKSEFGHCNVSRKYSANPLLWNRCRAMRYSYNQIQRGQKPKRNLTQGQIERLEEIGFKWKLK